MSLLSRVEDVLASMDVEGAQADKLLGDDLGMDSQELLCATLDLQNSLCVKIEDDELSREMSVLDLTTVISRKLAPAPIGSFDFSLSEDTVIRVPSGDVYKGLYEVDTWPLKLPHVRRIEKSYDDGLFQEFDMEVDGANGGIISVRSVRRCEPARILFFQPSPPKFMRHHCGEWILQPISADITHLLTRHYWRLSQAAAEAFPGQEGVATGDRIQSWLAEHARFALVCWKAHFEGNRR